MLDGSKLFEPVRCGEWNLPNRVLMAPLTRNRAQGDGVPKDMAIDYYRQRASAGLIITEATQISPQGKGYIDTPGIHSEPQVAAWRTITDAVHAAGGRIVLQLWHVGRVSHTSLQPEGQAPVAPSAIRANTQTFTPNGFEPTSEPVALTTAQIQSTLADYDRAARLARQAGFDGVEIHAANGYLIDQFLQTRSNQRTDAYGGSIPNRMRFLSEVIDAVTAVWGAHRTGVRLSPLGQFNDMGDSDPEALFSNVYDYLSTRQLAYLHVMERFPGVPITPEQEALTLRLRAHYKGFYIANGGYDGPRAQEALRQGHAHAIAFGRPFISNPDLPERLRRGAPLTEPDGSTFYGGGRKGYTDYPALPPEQD
ncbi:MAG: alkene reductase [Hahellaceae bacterium]|nr:alkene reductase [Hahellaceae bacterium]